MKKVYTCFCTDIIHEGHMNVIRKASEYGEVIVGVLCDSEMVRYNLFPSKSQDERVSMVEKIPEVSRVVIQSNIMYDSILKEMRPDFVIHGDNWKSGPESCIRNNLIAALEKYGGELIEVPYTYSQEVKKVDDRVKEYLAMPEQRRGRLRKLIERVSIVKNDLRFIVALLASYLKRRWCKIMRVEADRNLMPIKKIISLIDAL